MFVLFLALLFYFFIPSFLSFLLSFLSSVAATCDCDCDCDRDCKSVSHNLEQTNCCFRFQSWPSFCPPILSYLGSTLPYRFCQFGDHSRCSFGRLVCLFGKELPKQSLVVCFLFWLERLAGWLRRTEAC